jgi:demethylmenaquinone methyltransferase/2-methoxy-6-polyprenyl-1,4-benzoquinol methylase
VPRVEAALTEAYRVLKRGGHFLCLEFSHADVPGLDSLYEAYSFNVIPAMGGIVTGDSEAYRYLVESIRCFPSRAAFARMIEAAGFRRVTVRTMTGGIVAMHSGWKV